MKAGWSIACLTATALAACSSSKEPSSEVGLVDSGADSEPTPSSDGGDEASDASSCPLPVKVGSAACERCVSATCCDSILACDRDAACNIVLRCTRACLLKPNATPCIDKCLADTPAGADKYNAFDSCIAGIPPNGCYLDCS